jgi:hypothetical protein
MTCGWLGRDWADFAARSDTDAYMHPSNLGQDYLPLVSDRPTSGLCAAAKL